MSATCLIDADSSLYKAAFCAERTRHTIFYNGKPLLETFSKKDVNTFIKENEPHECTVESESEIDPIAFAYQNLDSIVDYILRQTKPDKYELFLTGSNNFRDKLATIKPYKGNRDKLKKPYYYHDVYDYAVNKYGATIVDGEEAEDRIGIINQGNTQDYLLVHIDKDLDQLAGYHYNPDMDLFYEIDQEEADFFFYCQILAGDSVDNVQGVPGLGLKKADKILRPFYGNNKELEKEVYATYLAAGIPSHFLETSRLVRIRRFENELWESKYVKV